MCVLSYVTASSHLQSLEMEVVTWVGTASASACSRAWAKVWTRSRSWVRRFPACWGTDVAVVQKVDPKAEPKDMRRVWCVWCELSEWCEWCGDCCADHARAKDNGQRYLCPLSEIACVHAYLCIAKNSPGLVLSPCTTKIYSTPETSVRKGRWRWCVEYRKDSIATSTPVLS